MHIRRSSLLAVVATLVSVVSFGYGTDLRAEEVVTPTIKIIDQDFRVVDSASLSLTVRIEAPEKDLAEGDLKLRLIERATSYQAFIDAKDDLNVQVIDQVNFKTSATARTPEGDYLVFVRIDRSGSDRESLNVRESGVYPLAVVFQSGETRVSTTVFIQAISSTDPPAPQLNVSYVANVQGHPLTTADGKVVVSQTTREQLERIATTVSTYRIPLIVSIGPEILGALSTDDDADNQALLRRVRRALLEQSLTAQPYVSIDPSGAARAGLSTEFTRQMRIGEDVMGTLLTTNPTKRQIWIAEDALDAFGANLIRDNGAQVVIMLPDASDSKPDAAKFPALTFDTAELPGGSAISIGRTDPFVAAALSDVSASPQVRAATAMAHIVVASEIAAADNSGVPTQLFVSTDNGSIPPEDVVGAFADLLATSPSISMGSTMVAGRSGKVVELPERTPNDLSEVAGVLGLLNASVTNVSSMLPEDSPLRNQWSTAAAIVASNRMTSEERNEYAAKIYDQINGLLDLITIPSQGSFTLPAKASEIRLQIRNDSEINVSVRVRLVSSKLSLAEESTVVQLDAKSTTDVAIPVRARSNGRFSVELQVTTPVGTTFVAPPTMLSARVTTLAGIGQMVSVALLLLILTWWVAHFRRSRRTALREGTVL